MAQALADALRREAGAAPAPNGDGGLSEAVAQQLIRRFTELPPAARPGVAAQRGRDEPAYWADHGELTGSIMAEIAGLTGRNVDLYRRVGRIHDVDYLAYPHDGRGRGDRHPVPLVKAMHAAGVHPAICRAVLEHAPYAGFDEGPSSALSASLSAAEDLATLVALEPPSDGVAALSPEARQLFDAAEPGIPIRGARPVRVEADVERFINRPLALALGADALEFDI